MTIVDESHMLALSERAIHLFTGAAYTFVAPLLEEGRTVDDIVAAAPPSPAAAAEIYYVLDRLQHHGVVREHDDSLPPRVAQFWDAVGVAPRAAAEALANGRVTLTTIGAVATGPLESSLASLAIPTGAGGTLGVVLTDDYLRPELELENEVHLRSNTPWLLARPLGSILWFGPLFRPGITACWACLAHRMRAQRSAERFVQRRKKGPFPRVSSSFSLPVTEALAASFIATEVAKWLAGVATPELETTLLSLDLTTMTMDRHPVVRRPQCAACGSLESVAPEPIRLQSRAKHFTSDGGFRSEAPEATLARYSRHVSMLTGVVSQLISDPHVDATAAPLCFSGRNASRIDDSLESLCGQFRSASGGKGKTEAQAKAGALAEAIERYSGVFDGSEPRIHATLADLGDEAIHPNTCMLYSDDQYARRREIRSLRSCRVPEPFDESSPVAWSQLWSLTHDRRRYLPTAYCYFDYEPPAAYCVADSNGCAAGNSIEEAILQGFLELVERDAVAIWWYNRLRRPAVDLDTFDEPYFAAVRQYYRSLHRELWVLDVTGDLGIPAFAAISRRTDMPAEDVTIGLGCHLDARLGILRAVTEANQFLPVVNGRQTPSSPFDTKSTEVLEWLRRATLASDPYLAPSSAPQRTSSDYPTVVRGDLKEDVEACVAIAAAHGLETLVLDQTRPDIGLPVVRVVIPGLRHFWQRLAPGRLYDVPVALGWLPAPLAESELNPVPVFF